MLDKEHALPMVAHFMAMLQLPKLTIDLGLVFVAAVLAAAKDNPVPSESLNQALAEVLKRYELANERWIANLVAQRKEAKLGKAYERAQTVIRALYKHLKNIEDFEEGPDQARAAELVKQLFPDKLKILRLPSAELFVKLRGLGIVTERHYLDELHALDAGRMVSALTKSLREYGEVYGLNGPELPGSESTLGKLYLDMMDAVRMYFLQVLAWVVVNPEYMKTAELLLSPAKRWIDLNKERGKTKNAKSDDANGSPGSGSGQGDGGSTNGPGSGQGDGGSTNGPGSGQGDGGSTNGSDGSDTPAADALGLDVSPVTAESTEAAPQEASASRSISEVDRVTVSVPLEVRTAASSSK